MDKYLSAKPGKILIVFFALAAAAVVIYISMSRDEKPYLLFLSGAGMKVPVTEIADNFEKETGIKIYLFFDGSKILRDYIINFKRGDLFLSGDEKNFDAVVEKGVIQDSSFVAWHIVSILVSPHYKGQINGLDDLAKKGVRLAISNPRMASLGRLVMERTIKRHPKGKEILKNVVVYGSSSDDILDLYRQGGIDAIIEWDVMAETPQGKGLVVVEIEDRYKIKDPLKIGLLKTSKNPGTARKFYDYFTTTGIEVFRKHGYNVER
jgi:molybdate transport system substrate-binding protein